MEQSTYCIHVCMIVCVCVHARVTNLFNRDRFCKNVGRVLPPQSVNHASDEQVERLQLQFFDALHHLEVLLLHLLSLPDELNEEPCPLQVMSEVLPVGQLLG